MRSVVAAAVALTVLTGAGVANAAVSTAINKPGPRFEAGLVSNADQKVEIPRAAALGDHVLRVEYEVNTPLATIVSDVSLAARNKIRIQPLVGWDNGVATPDLTPVAQWARALGPGGLSWKGAVSPYAITDIELGNENSFTYKSGEPTSARYKQLATSYGIQALKAAKAVSAANPKVGVLVELDDGNTGSPVWIQTVLKASGPQLAQLMHGPTIHPYGPAWQTRVARNFAAMKALGATKPCYMTEWGIATDNGRSMGDNYNFPASLTYTQAGQLITTNVAKMRTNLQIHQVLFYEVSDLKPSGSTNDKEAYFGAVHSDGTAKGAYTQAIKAALAPKTIAL